jgi:hypothetical protein
MIERRLEEKMGQDNKVWTVKTKIALFVGIGVGIISAVFSFYVWPGQLYALLIGTFVFLFGALFNFRGIVLGIMIAAGALFMLVMMGAEGTRSLLIPVTLIALVIVAAGEKLLSPGSFRSKNLRIVFSVFFSLLTGVVTFFSTVILFHNYHFYRGSYYQKVGLILPLIVGSVSAVFVYLTLKRWALMPRQRAVMEDKN